VVINTRSHGGHTVLKRRTWLLASRETAVEFDAAGKGNVESLSACRLCFCSYAIPIQRSMYGQCEDAFAMLTRRPVESASAVFTTSRLFPLHTQ